MHDKSSWCAYLVALGNFIMGLTLNDLALLVGIITAVFTAWSQWYWKRKEFQRGSK